MHGFKRSVCRDGLGAFWLGPPFLRFPGKNGFGRKRKYVTSVRMRISSFESSKEEITMIKMLPVALALSIISISSLAPAQQAGEDPEGMKLIFKDGFEQGRDRWETTDDSNWALHDGETGKAFGIIGRKSDYKPKYRSPLTIAMLKGLEVSDFVMTLRVKSMLDTGGHRDCCIFFNHQDAEHFYYVHLGAKPDPNSGQIMIVDGAPRIALTKNKNLTPWDDKWHDVKIVRDTKSGTIEVYFDDMKKPHMKCADKTFGKGRIGIGSFDDVNDFDDVRIYVKQ